MIERDRKQFELSVACFRIDSTKVETTMNWYMYGLAIVAIIAAVVARMSGRSRQKKQRMKTMIVLGSGGHTAEMIALLRNLALSKYTPRHYIVAVTDTLSLRKAEALEEEQEPTKVSSDQRKITHPGSRGQRAESWKASISNTKRDVGLDPGNGALEKARIDVIPRSREVGQSFFSSFFSSIYALFFAFRIVLAARPEVMLLNGPGTCLPIALVAVFGNIVGWMSCKIIYLESIARVKSMSLTGKILYKFRLTHLFLVQWPELQSLYPRTECVGRLY